MGVWACGRVGGTKRICHEMADALRAYNRRFAHSPSRPFARSPAPNKKTRTVFTVRAPILQSNSLLAVTFLDGYVVSAILVPDLH
jgi:hypothetical protein